MADEAENLIDELLAGVVQDLDLPPGLERTLHGLYDDVGKWMTEALDTGQWSIYAQGSVRLGTTVRQHAEPDYDVDSVAVLNVEKEQTTQRELKDAVGRALDGYLKARSSADGPRFTSVEEGRRCFTLDSTDPFHMDVLPAVPDPYSPPSGLWIPDRELRLWQPSNPAAFAAWFFDQMATQIRDAKAAFAMRTQVEVESVPDWRVRTTLQRAVQLLKAHRNCYFAQDDPSRPPSIVITTLAALAYRGENSLLDAVRSAASRMPELVERDGASYVVVNPAHPDENFADLWTEETARKLIRWVQALQSGLDAAVGIRTGLHRTADVLSSQFGAGPVSRSVERFGIDRDNARREGQLAVATTGAVGAVGVAVMPHTFHGAK